MKRLPTTIINHLEYFVLTNFIIIPKVENLRSILIIFIDDDGSYIYFFTKTKLRFILNSFFGLLFGKPLQVGYFYFNEVQLLINKLSIEHDYFYAFMIRTSSYGLKLENKKVHYAIDSMYLNYKKSQQNTSSFFWKIIYKIEVPLLFRTEKKHINFRN
jgi:hypothetical protein